MFISTCQFPNTHPTLRTGICEIYHLTYFKCLEQCLVCNKRSRNSCWMKKNCFSRSSDTFLTTSWRSFWDCWELITKMAVFPSECSQEWEQWKGFGEWVEAFLQLTHLAVQLADFAGINIPQFPPPPGHPSITIQLGHPSVWLWCFILEADTLPFLFVCMYTPGVIQRIGSATCQQACISKVGNSHQHIRQFHH